MVLDRYLDKRVAITLTNGYFYKGKVIDCDDTTITIKDVEGKDLTLQPAAILSIREVLE